MNSITMVRLTVDGNKAVDVHVCSRALEGSAGRQKGEEEPQAPAEFQCPFFSGKKWIV